MKLIGIKRALILAILLGINVAIAAVYFLQIDPMRSDAEAKLAGVNSDIAAESGKISSIKEDLATFKTTLPQYQDLEKKGFMLSQDRFKMSRDLDDVRNNAALAGFSFTIADIKKVPNTDADGAQMQLISSRIKVENVVSLIDVNFYDFIDLMMTQFPAHTRIQRFEVSRGDPLNPAALAHISRKETVNLISAKGDFDWLTLVPKQQAQNGQAPPGGL